uniref:Uncharacterized protein n=1 Tax=uncultured marine group II/III euryarchaeote KM3_203_F09 TaxID=1456423 RepID=A0A075GX82_9EURY|nr:hypothetical protein [uncultured marine group II/III euryarchaeote KM3_203_F09]
MLDGEGRWLLWFKLSCSVQAVKGSRCLPEPESTESEREPQIACLRSSASLPAAPSGAMPDLDAALPDDEAGSDDYDRDEDFDGDYQGAGGLVLTGSLDLAFECARRERVICRAGSLEARESGDSMPTRVGRASQGPICTPPGASGDLRREADSAPRARCGREALPQTKGQERGQARVRDRGRGVTRWRSRARDVRAASGRTCPRKGAMWMPVHRRSRELRRVRALRAVRRGERAHQVPGPQVRRGAAEHRVHHGGRRPADVVGLRRVGRGVLLRGVRRRDAADGRVAQGVRRGGSRGETAYKRLGGCPENRCPKTRILKNANSPSSGTSRTRVSAGSRSHILLFWASAGSKTVLLRPRVFGLSDHLDHPPDFCKLPGDVHRRAGGRRGEARPLPQSAREVPVVTRRAPACSGAMAEPNPGGPRLPREGPSVRVPGSAARSSSARVER